MHESNTFSRTHTNFSSFRIQTGNEILNVWTDAHHEMSGFIEGAAKFGYDLHPTFMADATPSGTVSAEAYETLAQKLISSLSAAKPFDGLLLAVHGAMVSEKFPDADGELVRRIREGFGERFPIIVTNDFHANVSEQIVAYSTALVIYKTNPHVDQRERGLQAAGILTRVLNGTNKPTQALAKPPMLLNIVHQNTSEEPLRSIMQLTRDLENDSRVLAASFAGGYQYADVHEMGPSAVVVTDNNETLAEQKAENLSKMLWDVREKLTFTLPDASEAVRLATESKDAPVVLVDMGDNIGGGSAGDSTFVLAELLRQGAAGWTIVIADPEAVAKCTDVGLESPVNLHVGGKTDDLHGLPIEVRGRVKCLHDGKYEEPEPRHGGTRYHDQGRTAVLEMAEISRSKPTFLVLTSKREPPFSLNQLRSVGIEPSRQRIIVVKAAIAYRAAYAPIARRIIEVDTLGLTCVNPAQFDYRKVRRPFWGL